MAKVWFITGTSKGFGRIWAEAALARGDRVAATARDSATLAPLTERYGVAPRAFLVAPLVGAFFIDFANLLLITLGINLLR